MAGVQFNRAWLGRDTELIYATELTCRAPREGSERIYAEADGELLSTLPVSIKMTDDAVNLLVPNMGGGPGLTPQPEP
jgi:diacylglycerol kinase family enzyme